jgi:hypothetical protein
MLGHTRSKVMRPSFSVKAAAVAAAACGSLATWSALANQTLSDHGANPINSEIVFVGGRLAQIQQPSMDATENVLELRRDQLQGPLKEREPRGVVAPRGAPSADSEYRDSNHPVQGKSSDSVPSESQTGERPDR